MIKIFYGNDRQAAQLAIDRLLGKNYELVEAENITRADLDSIFRGTSLFGEMRKILLKSLNENKECWELLPNYLDTTHDVIIWLATLDKRSVVYKAVEKAKQVECKEFKVAEQIDRTLVFKIADEAFAGKGAKAVKMCEQIEATNDPYMTMGAIISQAMRRLEMKNSKAARAIKILAKADMDMKSVTVDGWSIVKMALLKIGQL